MATALSAETERKLIVSVIPLVLPFALTFLARYVTQRQSDADERKTLWLGYRRLSRFLVIATLAAWWAMWDFNRLATLLPTLVPWLSHWLEPSSVEAVLFWTLPIVGIGTFLFLANITDAAVLKLKWTFADLVRLVWWRLVNFVVPLLMIATGFDDILNGDLWGCAWICGAGVIAILGTIFLRKAEGMKLHEVKASETRNRALAMARRMKIDLQQIYVVPAGRGHLTNAFGGGRTIGLTDSLGKYFDRPQMDFVIAHELAHVQQKHGRKQRLVAVAIFSPMMMLLFLFRQEVVSFRPLLDVLITVFPIAIFYLFSRRHEYEADRKAVEFTGDAETGARALARLRHVSGEPMQCSKFAEVFLTHPAFARRIEAICRSGSLPAAKMAEIFQKEGEHRVKRPQLVD